MDLRLLRWLGPQLHVLHSALTQRDWPLLRSRELWSRESCAGWRRRRQPRVVSSESRAADHSMGTAQQREHLAVGGAALAAVHSEEQGYLARELLAQEQAVGGQGQERPDPRVADSGNPAPQGGRGDCGERSAAPGP